jgi:hypothetical protein
MFAWHLVVATMIASGRSYWELFLGAKKSNMLAQLTLQQLGRGK